MDDDYVIHTGDSLDVLRKMEDETVDCAVTSPPYYALRDYGSGDKEIGKEDTPEEYVARLVAIFREVRRVLKPSGTLWLNIGDTYSGSSGGVTTDKSGLEGGKATQCEAHRAEKHPLVGIKPKDLIGIPWMVAFALRADGWYLRSDIIWYSTNKMPESVVDRCSRAHEYVFMLTKSPKYYFDYEAIEEEATGYDGRKDTMHKGSVKYADAEILTGQNVQSMAAKGHERWKFKNLQEKGQATHSMHERRAMGLPDVQYAVRRKRDVWSIPTKGYEGAHFATFPEKLVEPCVLAGCPWGGVVLDPFNGAGTTGVVALRHHRKYIGIELNPKYVEMAKKRIDESRAQLTFEDMTNEKFA